MTARRLPELSTKLLGDPELSARLKAGCASVAAEIGWDKLVEDLEVSYEAAVGALSLRPAVVAA